ncbi:MAG: Mrp/NBP35 family ATP-binding protein [Pseudomonadota bacterium]
MAEAATREAVEATLSTVTLPDGLALTASGRLRSLVVDDGKVGFAIAADPSELEAMEAVRRDAEARVSALAGVTRVLGALVADDGPRGTAPPPPADQRGLMGKVRRLAGARAPDESSAGLKVRERVPSHQPLRTPQPPGGNAPGGPGSPNAGRAEGKSNRTGPLPGVSRVIAVGAGKGGVGKSTVSFNLAVALAQMGWRVGLLDADIYGPSVPTLVGASSHKPAAPRGGFQPFEAYGLRVMSIGFLVRPEKAMVWRGPMVTGALSQLMRDTVWGNLDCLIVDMPPGTGDIALSLSQQTPLTGAVVVTTPQDLALVDVRKAEQMFTAVKVPILGIVENMSGFICPKCGEETQIFGHGGGEAEAARTHVPFLGRIPLTMAVREASDAGKPVAFDDGPVGEAYRTIAGGLMDSLAAQHQKPFPAIVFE